MTTNAYEVYDTLEPYTHSVIVVHLPKVALITQDMVKTDKRAALSLAKLHAVGLLEGVWIPPQEVRDLRALVAQRRKMVCMLTMAKNRLNSFLHRCHIKGPDGQTKFKPQNREWWEELPSTPKERFRILSDLDTLEFAGKQVQRIEEALKAEAGQDERVPFLVQLPGIGHTLAITILAAVGDITRFPSAKNLVGYAGLGAKVHFSGEKQITGKITKKGRKDLRFAMVEAANIAVMKHPYWKAMFERLEPIKGRAKTIVIVARKLLVAVWHVLTFEVVDKHADELQVTRMFYSFAYRIGVHNLPDGMSALEYTRHQLDRLGIGVNVDRFKRGSNSHKLPPSTLNV